MRNLVIAAILGGLGFGVYYLGCRYKAAERLNAYDRASYGLKNDLLKIGKKINGDDLRAVARRYAKATGVVIERIDVTLEPLTAENQARLPAMARKALGVVASMPGYRAPACIAGYHVWLAAKSGIVTRRGETLRFTPFDYVDPTVCASPEQKNEKVDWRNMR